MKKVNIEDSWFNLLEEEFSKSYFQSLRSFLRSEYHRKTIFPHPNNIFNAFNSTSVGNVKAVIIGQDPYHGPGQAHGLCFSVPIGILTPPSLKNIYKELADDIDIQIPSHGNLDSWAKQGVFLLNSVLTVESGKANSHKDIGWQEFTESVIKKLSEKRSNIVFLLWGRQAQEKSKLINKEKHCILETVHPSPLSAHSGFFGCKHFSKANDYLEKQNIKKINWEIL